MPVRPSTFRARREAGQRFNVEVDLGRIGAFSGGPCVPESELLFADLQTNADFNVDRRLGSGRAGFYHGHYLKGVGRTLLAGNWNLAEDEYHNSGLLFPSAAVRELLVSALLRARGVAHVVVPCTEILWSPLPDSLREVQRAAFAANLRLWPRRAARMPKVNARFHALSVKDGDFARFSNFAWWLSHFPQFGPGTQRSNVAAFFKLMAALLEERTPSGARSATNFDAEGLAIALASAFERSLRYFFDAWAVGVSWGSLHNNFTMDGRFLDLETPTIYPSATLGVPYDHDEDAEGPMPSTMTFDEPDGKILGLEVLSIGAQLLRFARLLFERLGLLLRNRLVGPTEGAFIRELVACLKAQLAPPHPLGSRASFVTYAVGRIGAALELTSTERDVVAAHLAWRARHLPLPADRLRPKRPPALTLHKLPREELAWPEPVAAVTTYVPDFVRARLPGGDPKNLAYNECLRELDQTEDEDALRARLDVAAVRLGAD